ncbi:hypothetical protein LTR84_001733 [Exophiala bonariae]|uniref:SMP domain-containing protein n=1 Tax=Exophiala bonariae TaxID=1690606 RepID=A0AAV9NEV5_9EURO|nr:hypothetical protein LTR84_001733 [Exophiala bonariae]
MTSSEITEEHATAVVEDLTNGFTANRPVSDTDTSTTVRGSASNTLVSGEPVGDSATRSSSAAVARHNNQDIEPPTADNNLKPDITYERAPTTAEAVKHAPAFDTNNATMDDE